MKSGIYTITNIKNGRRYIGSAVHFAQRWHMHRYHLKRGTHQNSHLQRAWNKYGEAAFRFDKVQLVEPEMLIAVEQEWLDQHWHEGLYNRRRFAANNLGVPHSEEERQRMSERQKKLWEKNREKMLKNLQKVHESNKGRKQSAEQREKRRQTMLGREMHPASLEALRASRANRDYSYVGEIKAGDFIVTLPTGEEVEVRNLTEFARQHGLSQANLCAVAKGRRKQHKGYMVRPAA